MSNIVAGELASNDLMGSGPHGSGEAQAVTLSLPACMSQNRVLPSLMAAALS
jgi:hypothetical protein